ELLGPVVAVEALLDDLVDEVIGNELAAGDVGPGLLAGGRAVGDGRAQHVPGADMRQAEALAQQLGLGALPAAWRTEKNQAHGGLSHDEQADTLRTTIRSRLLYSRKLRAAPQDEGSRIED